MDLMVEFMNLGNSILDSLDHDDENEIQSLVNQLKEMWPQLANVTLTLFGEKYPISKMEEDMQQNLRQTVALLLFMTK